MSRSALFTVVLVCTLAAALAGCSAKPDWNRAVHPTVLAKGQLDYFWQNIIPLDGGRKLVAIEQLDEILYCMANDNTLYAFDARSGVSLWTREVARPGMPVLGLAHVDRAMLPDMLGQRNIIVGETSRRKPYDLLIVANIASVMIIDRTTGDLMEEIQFERAGFIANTPPAVDGQRIFIGGLQGWCHAIELANSVEVWKTYTVGPMSAAPALLGELLFLADEAGVVYGLQVEPNAVIRLWPETHLDPQADSAIRADMAVTPEAVYVGSIDYSVYAFEPLTGRRLWRFRCGGPITEGLLAGRTSVYAKADRDGLYAIDRAGGDEAKWIMPDGRMVVAEMNDKVYVLDKKNYLVIADAESGQVDLALPMTGLKLFTPNVSAPSIYAASPNGLVCCIKAADGQSAMTTPAAPAAPAPEADSQNGQ